jgi:nucleoside-diphosphate-sugar epimerase
MKIFITGATGYIGSQLVNRLINDGHELSVLTRPNSSLNALKTNLPLISFYTYDGTIGSLLNAFKLAEPTVVFHIASLFLAQHTPDDISRLVDSNVNFPAQLLEAMCVSGVKQLVNTGTSWQHFQNESYNPVNFYAATKQAFESLIAYYVEAQDFKVITLKLFDTYGPSDNRKKIFTLLRDAIRNGSTLRMSPGQQLLDLVYIDDVIDAFLITLQCLNDIHKSETYSVSTPHRLSLRKLVSLYSEAVGRPISIDWGGLPYRSREVLTPWENHTSVPNWTPKINLKQGISLMEHDRKINGLLSELN